MGRPKRSTTEQIEDAFMDLSLDEQSRMLYTLKSLARMKERLARAEGGKTDAPASAAREVGGPVPR